MDRLDVARAQAQPFFDEAERLRVEASRVARKWWTLGPLRAALLRWQADQEEELGFLKFQFPVPELDEAQSDITFME